MAKFLALSKARIARLSLGIALVVAVFLAAPLAVHGVRRALQPELVRPSIEATVVAVDRPVPLVATPQLPLADVELRWAESFGENWPECLSVPVLGRSGTDGIISVPALERMALLGSDKDRIDYYCMSHQGRVIGEWGRMHESEESNPQFWLCWVPKVASELAEPPCREHPNYSLKRTNQSLRD